MLRAAFLATLLAVLGQGTGYFSLAARDTACAQSCPDDDEDGQCPSDCACCSCCPHHPPLVVGAAVRSEVRLVASVEFVERHSEPPTTVPRDILHVPKSLLT